MRIPAATYRIQFSPAFRFEHARAIVPYLADLGISDIYTSPVMKSVSGSTHGYDVVDTTAIDPELGGPEGLKTLGDSLSRHGMACLQDIVPNHMAFDSENRMLMDVIENGENSRISRFFDIEWDHHYENLKGRLLTPFLGRFYGESLEDGQIKLLYGIDGVTFDYYDLRLPMRIETYETLLCHDSELLESSLGKYDPDLIKYLATLYSLRDLPGGNRLDERVRKKVGDTYIIVEKVTQPDESLPAEWPVEGTTGYDFMNVVSGIFCDTRNEKDFDRIYRRFTGFGTPFHTLVAYVDFVDRVLGSEGENSFLESLKAFQRKVAHFGMLNSLGQTLNRITAPGVPDFYQGTELWDLNLVDPDNRRPVDFEKRQALVREMKDRIANDRTGYLQEILASMADGRVELYLVYSALHSRAADLDLYRNGDYIPIGTEGDLERHVIAYARRLGDRWSITVVPRFPASLIAEGELPIGQEKWLDTRFVLPTDAPCRWIESLGGETVSGEKTLQVGDILRRFPVALLTKPEAAA